VSFDKAAQNTQTKIGLKSLNLKRMFSKTKYKGFLLNFIAYLKLGIHYQSARFLLKKTGDNVQKNMEILEV
jgi:hypothetical protein